MPMRLFLIFILSGAALAGDLPVPELSTPSEKTVKTTPAPAALLESVQKAWDEVKSYQSSFKQIIFAKRLGTKEESTGTLYVVKPDRLRWESKTDGSVQIMNEKKLTVIQKNKRRQSTVVDLYGDLTKVMDPKPLSFLSGKAKFKDLYVVSLLSENKDVAELKFAAKGNPAETLVAEIDKNSYLLRSLTSETVDSRVRTEFTSTKTNTKLDEKLFEYVPGPKDVVHKND